MIVKNKTNEIQTNPQLQSIQAAKITQEQLDSYAEMVRRATKYISDVLPDISDFTACFNGYKIPVKELLTIE